MTKYLYCLPIFLLIASCNAQPAKTESELKENLSQLGDSIEVTPSAIEELYERYKKDPMSTSKGTVSDGSLVNGTIMPFEGDNFRYFDTTSYLSRRAFVNNRVKSTILQTYDSLQSCSKTFFGLMECSNEHGGKLFPHQTHQNGLSVDFMVPILKNGEISSDLNDLGVDHYFMEFDDNGVYKADKNYQIDFNTMALHLLILQEEAKANGLEIDKIILNISLKDNLFATPNGKKLKETGVYFALKLTPLIDNLHDDHYHVDFKIR